MSISVQVLDISEYNELPTVANGYTLVYDGNVTTVDDQGTSISLSSPYILGTQTFTSIYLQTNGWIQFLNTTYPTGSIAYSESIADLVTNYGIAVAWDDLYVYAGDSIGYKYANNNTQIIVNYNISRISNPSLRIQFKMTINLINHPTSPGAIRIALGRIEITGDGIFGLAYGPASTVPTGNTMNYIVSSTPTNFVYPNIPVQLFSGSSSNYLTNKTIVYNIEYDTTYFIGSGELSNTIVNANTLKQKIVISGYTSIGASAFLNASGVTSITIPSSVTSIGASAFKGMTGLTSITIPSSVTSIGGSNAFQGSGITTAFFEVSTLLDGLSMTPGPNKTLYGKSSMSIYLSYKVFNGTGQLTSTVVNDNYLSYVRNLTITGFSSIGASAFQNASELTSITIPSSVTSIDATAFLNSGLTSAIFAVSTYFSTFSLINTSATQSFFGKTGVTVSALDTKIFSGSAAVSLSSATAQLNEATNVVIEGYTNIGSSAFLNASNITSVTIPSSLTYISSNAFQNATSLTSITIPAAVTFISATSVFQNALSLTSINVDSSNTFYSSDSGVLYNFAKTTLIQYPVGNTQTSYIIPSTVTAINPYAFYGAKNLKSVTIPSASTFVSIGSNAFSHATGLESITIPSTVTNIGTSAFQNATSLTTVNYAGTSTLKIIGSSAFQNATSLTSINIPASVTSISATSVFQNALSLTSINVDPNNTTYFSDNGILYNKPSKNTLIQYPLGSSQTSYTILSTVTTINSNAFYGANNLKSVTLPSASTFVSIGTNAFRGALGLTSITIPSNVSIIDQSAFFGATSLTTVTFDGTPKLTTIGASAFQNATSLTSITIPQTVNNISTTSFQNTLSLTSINVNANNLTYSSDSGVLYTKSSQNTLIQYPVGNTQTSYTIPTTVTAINAYAFYNANNLKSVTLPDTSTFTSIGSYAFRGALGLTSITIPSNVSIIDQSAFFGATSLTTVTFDGTPKLTTIGASAFQNATSLTSITIPQTVNNISTTSFQNTLSLTSINVNANNITYLSDNGVLYDKNITQLIQYPLGNTQTSYAIPSTVSIFSNSNALNGANNLTSITCDPNSTFLSIDSYGVLYDKTKRYIYQYPCGNTRTSYTIPSSVTNMSTYAFQSAKYLQSINVDPMNTIYSSDSNGVLFNKTKTNLLQYPLSNTQTTYSIPLTVTTISTYAFQDASNLTSVTIQTPLNGTTISDYAFQNAASLKSITMPNSVTSIGFKAFQGSGLTSTKFESEINYPTFAIQNKSTPQYFLGKENVVIITNVLVLDGFGELTYNNVNDKLNDMTRRVIISGYSSIGTNAFRDALGVTSVTIRSSVTSIGANAFQGMTGLTTITIPSLVTSIGASAFKGMTGLTTITIPSSVTSIDSDAFHSSGIISATFEVSTLLDGLSITRGPNKTLYGKSGIAVYLSSNVFNGNGELTSAIVNDNNLSYVRNLTITGFNSIGASAFLGITGITSITITSSVTSIGASAFQGMTGLTSITIPSSVTFIGANAFLSSGITSAIFQESTLLDGLGVIPGTGKTLYGKSGIAVSWITKVYSGNGSLTATMTNYGVTLYGATKARFVGYSGIAYASFWYISTLTSVTISSSITTIAYAAFGGCPLTEIIVDPANNYYTSINNVLFNKDQTLLNLYPTGSTATTYTIPSTVIRIEDSALYFARNLKSINLNNIITSIGQSAFMGTVLTSLTIPASVTSIGTNILTEVGTIQTYTVDANNNYYSSDSYGALFNKSKTIFMYYPGANTSNTSYTIPSTVTSMPDGSNFYGASTLRSITIPYGVTKINGYAFAYCSSLTNITLPASLADMSDAYYFYFATNLTSITIPASVTTIGIYAFSQSGITSAIFEESTLLDNLSPSVIPGTGKTLYDKTGINVSWITKVFNGSGSLTGATALLYGATKARVTTYSSIGSSAFLNATGLRSITIPSSVTSIGESAFNGSGLTSVIIPSSVTSIGVSAFQNMPNLPEITVNPSNNNYSSDSNGVLFNKNITTLVQYPKGNSRTLYSIPVSVTMIGNSAFSNATSLTSITIPSGVTSIGQQAFIYASKLSSITFAEGSKLTSIENDAFYNTALTSITIPSSVTSIGQGAFSYVSSLTSITIPASVTSIGIWMFNSALALTSITIPSGVTSIGEGMFYNTPSLTSITIPTSVISIGYRAFEGASKLSSISIPSGVTSIGARAFFGASALTSITIPEGVTSIGTNAFAYSGLISALVSVDRLGTTNFPLAVGTGQTIGGKTGVNVTSYKLFLGTGVLTNATPQLGGATSAVIVGYTSIGESAFKGATTLSTVTFRLGVGESSVLSSIGALAFENTALTTVFFESASTVKKLGVLNVDLINGYTVSSFYGKASVTFIYTEAVRSTISAAPTAIISNNTFTSLLTNMGMNISNMTSQVIPITNDPYIEYSAKLTIPNGNLSTLSDVNKANIIDTVKSLYAAQLGININKIIVTLINGSIIANVNVLKDGVTDAMVPICFPKGTPVTTNQGVIAIEKLNPDIHTIRGKKIVAITQTRPIFEEIIAIDKNALGKNVPSAPIQISKEHKVFYKREMVKANDLVEVCEGVRRIPYNGETLYNVLMEKHDKMMINNLICETLDPDNIMAKICGGKYNRYEQSNICKELNDIIKENNVKAYIKLYDSLK